MLRSLAAALAFAGAVMTLSGDEASARQSLAIEPKPVIVGGRPAGCPARYCGCAAARYVGLKGAHWNLAANWLRLPRAAPAPGMAAARRGHVFILKRHVRGNRWLVWDPNSGRGLTRIHVRSLAGFTVVNPRSGIYASARRR